MAITNFDYVGNTTTDTLTAFAGGGQANATLLKFGNNVATVVATAADSLKLPIGLTGGNNVGGDVRVFNAGANATTVYPQTGGVIGTQAVNTGLSVPAGKSATFTLIRQPTGADVWGYNLSA